ncbi:MAG: hypothetical protein AAGI11_12240 [Pseudomonadota bacterium]
MSASRASRRPFYMTLLALLLASCADDDIFISGCEPQGEMRVYCDIGTPEDIAALPDGQSLLLAHFGGMGQGNGSVSLFDTKSEALIELYPGASAAPEKTLISWGEPDCRPPDRAAFSPHGTHLHRLENGALRYLLVNHGGRESIEMFEVSGSGENTRLSWRGCVLAAPDTVINDVVGLADGDVIFTRMLHDGGLWEMLTSIVGFNTGDLWRWSADSGLRILPGTTANQPNGLEISADERFVFANMYMTGEVWKVKADTGEVVSRAAIASADNSAWGSDGRLWIATHPDKFANIVACFENQDQVCGAAFEIVALDTETMTAERVFAHRGPPMGAATVAVPQAGRVYMGSFTGDRMISVPDFGATAD